MRFHKITAQLRESPALVFDLLPTHRGGPNHMVAPDLAASHQPVLSTNARGTKRGRISSEEVHVTRAQAPETKGGADLI